MKIRYELGGSIFSTLRVTGLVAQPEQESPVRRLEIGEIELQYSLPGFVRNGFPGLLKTVRLKDFYLEIDQSKIANRPHLAPAPEAFFDSSTHRKGSTQGELRFSSDLPGTGGDRGLQPRLTRVGGRLWLVSRSLCFPIARERSASGVFRRQARQRSRISQRRQRLRIGIFFPPISRLGRRSASSG